MEMLVMVAGEKCYHGMVGCSFLLISGHSFDNCDSEFIYKICLHRFDTFIVALCLL